MIGRSMKPVHLLYACARTYYSGQAFIRVLYYSQECQSVLVDPRIYLQLMRTRLRAANHFFVIDRNIPPRPPRPPRPPGVDRSARGVA